MRVRVISKRLPQVARVAAGIVVGIGAVVLTGWAAGVQRMIHLFPHTVAMNLVTAATFILAGISLAQRAKPDNTNSWGPLLGAVVALLGALKLADFFDALPFNVDHLLFPARAQDGGLYPLSEIAPNTGLNFLLCGLGLLLLDRETRRGFRVAQALVLLTGLIALLALIGYSYRALMLYRVRGSIPMAFETAVGFAVFSIGFLAARPEQGLMRLFLSPTSGGAVARRLLPMAILIPWGLGALLLLGEQSGRIERDSAISTFAVASIVIFTGLIWRNAKLLYLADAERARAERRIAVQHNATRVLAEAKGFATPLKELLRAVGQNLQWPFAAIWVADPNAKVLRCSETWHAGNDGLANFAGFARQQTFRPGEALPGRIWGSGQAAWDSDMEENSPLAAAAHQVGLRGAFGFPIRVGQEIYGVTEFFSRQVEPVDEALLEMLTAVGSQVGLFIERARIEEQLREASANLQRSNTDLQQFANLASHDLLEPLRMVSSYLQLLRDRASGKLDPRATEFLNLALDGAGRMRALIDDLLEYSRVDVRGHALEPVECDEVLGSALSNLKVAIEEANAVIEREPLPKVRGDRVQLTQLFQNLVGNAIKFQGAEPPRIRVQAERRDNEWVFMVRDNGIGIEPQFYERIFVIFQRLHTRQEYSGTGMGLAICKKIVERHGGRIWVESAVDKGSTFYFTLPVLEK